MALRLLLLTLLGVGVGVIASLITIGVLRFIGWLHGLLSGDGLVAGLLLPVLGGFMVGLLMYARAHQQSGSRDAEQHCANNAGSMHQLGTAQVIYAVQLREGMPSLWRGLRFGAAACISVACGASVGILGPLIYLGAMVGQLAEYLRVPVVNLRASAIASGVAASITTVFGAPIAGVLFVHEVLLRHFSVQVAAPVTLAAVSSYLLSQNLFGQSIWINTGTYNNRFGFELLLFVFFGLACACVAIAFMHCLIWFAQYSNRIHVPAWLRPGMAGMLVGLVGLWLPELASLNVNGLDLPRLFSTYTGLEMGAFLALKILLTGLCLGMGFVGGVFGPSLIIGLFFGSFFWWLIDSLGIPNSGVDVYALGGMMAITSCVMGAPFATVLIVFEITQSYELTIVAMVGVAFASLLSTRVFGKSYADVQLARMGTDIHLGGEHAILHKRQIRDLVQPDVLRLDMTMRADKAVPIMLGAGRTEAAVCDAHGTCLGVVRLMDLLDRGRASVDTLLVHDWPVLDRSTNLWSAMNLFSNFVGETAPVVDSEGKLVGMVSKGMVMQAYVGIVEGERELHYTNL